MQLLDACLSLATADERLAIKQAIESHVLELAGLGLWIIGGDNTERDKREVVRNFAIQALDAILARTPAAVSGIDMARPHERITILRYFLRAEHIDWINNELVVGMVRYVDLCGTVGPPNPELVDVNSADLAEQPSLVTCEYKRLYGTIQRSGKRPKATIRKTP